MKCESCKEENFEDAMYCENCGKELRQARAEPAPAGSSAAPPEEPPAAVYCETCGKRRPDSQAPHIEASTPAQEMALQPSQNDIIRCSICMKENPATENYCQDCGNDPGSERSGLTAAQETAVYAQAVLQIKEAPQAVSSEHYPAAPPQILPSRLMLASGSKEFPLAGEVVTIGRRSPADGIYPAVDLTDDDPDAYISRRHAQFVRSGSQYVFEDLGSGNGSFINNRRIEKGIRQSLNDGDQLRLGKTELIFRA